MSQELAIEAAAARLGVVDALLFRRVTASTWVHLGGLGRGRGWAGLVELDAAQDPLLAAVPAEPGGVHVLTHDPAERVMGPYYACGSALVRLSHDVIVVLGNPTEPLYADCSEQDLHRLAEGLDSQLEDVTPSKRLADELEVLHAVRTLTSNVASDLTGTLRHILDVAVTSLSCEVGLLRDGAGHTVVTSSWSGVSRSDPAIATALDVLESRSGGRPLCLQDVGDDPALMPLGRAQGVQSLLAVPMPAPVGGILVLAHTSAGPRGFTGLCQQLGAQLADAAGILAHTAALREELRVAVSELSRAARRDALTGLGNRLRWDEALADAQERVDAGAVATVITLDVDGLKHLNDTCGHAAGDLLLQRCAEVLRDHSRDDDVVVRLGGDEFAILLPLPDRQAQQRLAVLRDHLGGVTSCDRTVAASLGMATTRPGGSVADTAREADAAMYAAKRARRRTDVPFAPAQRGTQQPLDGSRRADSMNGHDPAGELYIP